MSIADETSWLKARVDRRVLRRFRRHCRALGLAWRDELATVVADHEARLFARLERRRKDAAASRLKEMLGVD